jgi:hypothetical protein
MGAVDCTLILDGAAKSGGATVDLVASATPWVIGRIHVAETQRSDRGHLRDVFAGFGPMKM